MQLYLLGQMKMDCILAARKGEADGNGVAA